LSWLPTALSGPVVGFFAARVLFELWPAQCAVLAAWPGALVLAALVLLLELGLQVAWQRITRRFMLHTSHPTLCASHFELHAPFLLLLVYVFWPRVNPLMGGVLLGGAIMQSAALGLRALSDQHPRLPRLAVPAALVIVTLAVYLRTMGRTVGTADTFEFQVVAPTLGIAHPTGYPLLILIGKLFSFIPFGSMAWRVNLVSVLFAVLAVTLVYFTVARLTERRAVAVLAASSLAFSRVFWSQALQVEVYSLNAACVTAILLLLVADRDVAPSHKWRMFALGAVYGMGLTNHLTMLILTPAVALSVLIDRPRMTRGDWLLAAGCFFAPLLIVLYIPLRWPALHGGEWMSFGDFIAWITGQQFRGALQIDLWRDPVRWRIISEAMVGAFGPAGAVLATAGLIGLAVCRWKMALVTFVAWVGYFAYGLVYNVPDVSVFVLPAHIIMAIWIGVAGFWILNFGLQVLQHGAWAAALIWGMLSLLPLGLAWTNAPLVDRSETGQELYRWGKYVMNLPMPAGSAILADSEKIAPLYYIKRIEQVRPDVETLVLGDEGLYRAELDRRVAAGQPVYLARYLPGLAGPYHLHSLGPLVRVMPRPIMSPPPMQRKLEGANWGGNKVALLGLDVEQGQDGVAWRITLYWQARARLDDNYHVRLRWVGPDDQVWWQDHGAHPVNGYSPTATWQPDEIVADYHEIPADATIPPALLRLDVGLFLPFRDEGLNCDGTDSPWFTLVLLDNIPQPQRVALSQELRYIYGGELLISGVTGPGVSPAGEPVNVTFEWSRIKPGPDRTLGLRWVDARGVEVSAVQADPYAGGYPTSRWPVGSLQRGRVTLPAPSMPGVYTLYLGWLDSEGRALPAQCAWLSPITHSCAVGRLNVVEQAHGQGINFDNQVMLLDAQIGRTEMHPNETLDVRLRWQGLRQWNVDYTVFVHLLGPDGKLYGQVDQWPVDGTLATTDWPPGRVIDDPYRVPLAGNAPPGTYQIEVGWYLLATLRRLPVVDAAGRPVDDHVIVGTVTVLP